MGISPTFFLKTNKHDDFTDIFLTNKHGDFTNRNGDLTNKHGGIGGNHEISWIMDMISE